MSQPSWSSNYADLCDDGSIRFGAECVICGARYATPTETIAPELVATAIPGSALMQEIADLKYQRFAEFDAAFKELSITCFRCGRTACVECWDDDNRMCAECVVARGLTRSPRVGSQRHGPLQDGRLERFAQGRYSDVGQPQWLSKLIESRTAPGDDSLSGTAPGARQGVSSEPADPSGMNRAASLVTALPFEPAAPGGLVTESTARFPTPMPAGATTGTAASRADTLMDAPGDERFETIEGNATSNMVTCPRCGTANYDFVTRCTLCQLQLIQICQVCQRLNAGHFKQCEFCGAPLQQPQGWSGVREAIKQVPADQVPRQRLSAPPASALPVPQPRAKKVSLPLGVSTGAPGVDAAALAAPAHSTFGPFAAPSAPRQRARSSWSLWDVLINSVERLASVILFAGLLVIICAVVAAEVSPQADAFITSLIHVDIHAMIAQFIQQIQQTTHQSK